MTLLWQIEVEIVNGKTTPLACKEAGITVQTFYRWRKEFGGLKLDPAKRLKELERENSKLKRLVAELSLEKQVLKDIAEEKDCADILQQIAACRGAVNGLLVEIVEGEIKFHVVSKDTKVGSLESKAAESLVEILHRYIK